LAVFATIWTIPGLFAGIFTNSNLPKAAISFLRCEYLVNPMGIDAVNPRLSWIITSDQRNERQKAYRILVASSPELLGLDKGDLWDTGKVSSDETAQIVYHGQPLASREACYWKVRIWDKNGRSAWSPVAYWSMGLLQSGDWTAKWIGAGIATPDPAGRLTIRRATYHADDSEDGADVTDALVRRVDNNGLSLVVNNETLGVDPAQQHVKQLRVEYEWAGQAHTLEVNEKQTLTLPPESAALPYLRKKL
jgi:alpha-L-rhamnosidase